MNIQKSGIQCLLLDDGLREVQEMANGLSWHGRISNGSVYRLVRIGPAAEVRVRYSRKHWYGVDGTAKRISRKRSDSEDASVWPVFGKTPITNTAKSSIETAVYKNASRNRETATTFTGHRVGGRDYRPFRSVHSKGSTNGCFVFKRQESKPFWPTGLRRNLTVKLHGRMRILS